MDYNARMSQQFRKTQAGRGPSGTGQGKQKKDDGDEFMRLSDIEIAGCINDIGVPFSAADLYHPQPQQIQRVFEWFAELFMNTTRETVEPAMREAAKDVCGEDMMDIVPPETRNLMGFYASLRRLLIESGVQDLTLMDLIRPTHPRLVKLFSYIINFVRFRESQNEVIDKHFNTLGSTKLQIETLYDSNQSLQARLFALKSQRQSLEHTHREKTARNNQLKEKLLELKKAQERVALDMERVRRTKNELTATLTEKTERTVALQKECERLSPYASQSSAELQAQLNELSLSLARDRNAADALGRRHRALQTSASSFHAAANDVSPLITLLKGTSQDLGDEESEALEAQKRREVLGERTRDVNEIQRTEGLLRRQLEGWIERTKTVREQGEERAGRDGERMRELRGEYERLGHERGERGREVERRRVRVEQIEKKMADLKENIENEIHAAYDQYQKMDAHIKLYVTEMDQALVF